MAISGSSEPFRHFNATLLSAGTYQVIVTDDQDGNGYCVSVNEQPMFSGGQRIAFWIRSVKDKTGI